MTSEDIQIGKKTLLQEEKGLLLDKRSGANDKGGTSNYVNLNQTRRS